MSARPGTRGQRLVYLALDADQSRDPERRGLVAFVETHEQHVVIEIPLPEESVQDVADELTGYALVLQRVARYASDVPS